MTVATCVLSDHVATCLPVSTSPVTSANAVVDCQLQDLLQCFERHPPTAAPNRSLLQRRHAAEFPTESTFDVFSRTVCRANAVPRKELFETWAVAIYVKEHFPACRRVADLAGGHGLLSWALLVVLEDSDVDDGMEKSRETQQPRTAVCIDKRMPPSAEKVAAAMLEEYPHLKGRWDYVEGKLNDVTISYTDNNSADDTQIDPSPASSKTLLCGIHACATLSDFILSLAVQGNAPVVLLPCCHTKKSLYKPERIEYDKNRKQLATSSRNPLAQYVDLQRVKRLQRAGYSVERSTIPEQFTPQNAIILASPPLTKQSQKQDPYATCVPATNIRRNRQPPLKSMLIPLDDTEEARTTIRSITGRKQPPPHAFCVSLAMPKDQSQHVKPDDLSALLHRILQMMSAEEDKANTQSTALSSYCKKVKTDYTDSEAFFHAQSGKFFRTFRIDYHIDGTLGKDFQRKEAARQLHESLCSQIPESFPGCTVRS